MRTLSAISHLSRSIRNISPLCRLPSSRSRAIFSRRERYCYSLRDQSPSSALRARKTSHEREVRGLYGFREKHVLFSSSRKQCIFLEQVIWVELFFAPKRKRTPGTLAMGHLFAQRALLVTVLLSACVINLPSALRARKAFLEPAPHGTHGVREKHVLFTTKENIKGGKAGARRQKKLASASQRAPFVLPLQDICRKAQQTQSKQSVTCRVHLSYLRDRDIHARFR